MSCRSSRSSFHSRSRRYDTIARRLPFTASSARRDMSRSNHRRAVRFATIMPAHVSRARPATSSSAKRSARSMFRSWHGSGSTPRRFRVRRRSRTTPVSSGREEHVLTRPGAVVVVVLFGLGMALLALERLRPLRRPTRPLLPRLGVNAAVTALALLAAGLAVRPVAVHILGWTAAERAGFLQVLPLPGPAAFAAAFLLLDLSFYYWHRLNHRWAPPLALPQRAPCRSRPRRQHGPPLPLRRGPPLGRVPGGAGAVDRTERHHLPGLRARLPGQHAFPPQQRPAAAPRRARAELDARQPAHARDPPFRPAGRDQLELLRGVPVVGLAARDTGPGRAPARHHRGGARLRGARRQPARARAGDAVPRPAQLLALPGASARPRRPTHACMVD